MPTPSEFARLVGIMSRLRNPETGCPWDLQQTHDSLRRYLLEETYEFFEALDEGDDKEIASELGDLLLQIVFHAQLASEEKRFDIEDVARSISDKMVRRHPHVFADVDVRDSDEVLQNWEAIKAEERGGATRSLLARIPKGIPALMEAEELGRAAKKVNFDWATPAQVNEKVQEEFAELQRALVKGDRDEIAAEIGDLHFSLAQLSRHLKLSAEDIAQSANRKFRRRFEFIENTLGPLDGTQSQEALESAWLMAKSNEGDHD